MRRAASTSRYGWAQIRRCICTDAVFAAAPVGFRSLLCCMNEPCKMHAGMEVEPAICAVPLPFKNLAPYHGMDKEGKEEHPKALI